MNMNFERYENESDLDYKKRLVYGKLIYKTIDCDYAALSEYIFGKQFSHIRQSRLVHAFIQHDVISGCELCPGIVCHIFAVE